MRIYVSHSRSFDYINELYKPLLDSPISQQHQLVLPFMGGGGQSGDTKAVLQAVNIVVAEVSWGNTGQGIELGWADMLGKPILCFYRNGHNPSSSLAMITHHMYPYKDPLDMVRQLESMLQVKPIPSDTINAGHQIMKGVN